VNQIFIPIERLHLETVFEKGERVDYALLEPPGHTSPLRIRFEDLRRELSERFGADLTNATVAERIARMQDEQLLVTVVLEEGTARRWTLSIRARFPHELQQRAPAARLGEQRRSPRHALANRQDVRVELGDRSLEGTVYNVSEHGLGIAVLTTQAQSSDEPLRLEQSVEVIANGQRAVGRIASQYPAAGGCVLGIELTERMRLPGLPQIEA
jgi:hypothetical protein